MWRAFWNWYERTYLLNIGIATGLFVLQIAHLVWLSGAVVSERLFDVTFIHFTGFFEYVVVFIDYTEIPALISVSLIYINELRHKKNLKTILYLLFLNLQWLHIFWITDEFVETSFNGVGTVFPLWLAWMAIFIDYLEVPVMFDTMKRFMRALRQKPLTEAFEVLREE